MASEHDRYDGLALGHVLGGLTGPDASDFRAHLAACQDCRRRVVELRGIAAELVEAERDERSRAPLQTEVVRRDEEDADEVGPQPRRLRVGHLLVVTVVVVMLAAGVAFWNLHLRTVVAAYDDAVESQSEALRDLATGVALDTEFGAGVSGLVVAGNGSLAFTLVGLDLAEGERAVVWATNSDGETEWVTQAPAELLRGGTYAGVVENDGISALTFSVEDAPLRGEPAGPVLARTHLQKDAEG